jgi:hypothetical protein
VKPYRFLAEADQEFHDHIRYFDAQDTSVGDRFIDEVGAVIRDIRRYPESGLHLPGNVRKRVVRVFPYNVLYLNRSHHRRHRASSETSRLLAQAAAGRSLRRKKISSSLLN